METGRKVSCAEIRHCICLLLVPDRTSCEIPCIARVEKSGSILIKSHRETQKTIEMHRDFSVALCEPPDLLSVSS